MNLLTEVMNFVNENYLKLVIGLVLILMAIIGYYAEKTGFGNKLKKENKENKENEENKIDINNIGLNDFVDNNSMPANNNIDNNLIQNQDINNGNMMQQQNQIINKAVQSTALPDINSQMNQNAFYPNVENKINPISVPIVENTNLQNIESSVQNSVDINNNLDSPNTEIVNKDTSDINLEEEFKKILSDEEAIQNDLMADINNMEIEPLENVDFSNNNAYAKLSSNIDLPEINEFEKDGDIWKF